MGATNRRQRFSLRKRLHSFKYAFAGIRLLFSEEHNAWIHAGITLAVVLAGVLLHVTVSEWVAIALCIGLVLAAEAVNSSIERIADFLTIERDDRIRDIKDLAAGAVLLCAIAAAGVGLVVFVPYIVSIGQ
ncbi:MAG: diacylglycerol kinase family protein [Bacteroidales bacterium]|nr:diacylglycerol kinase family protein [Bacteroidales bacterium]